MGISVIGAIIAAGAAIWTKIAPMLAENPTDKETMIGAVVGGVFVVYIILVVIGFVMKRKSP
jgi:hypothetical protein